MEFEKLLGKENPMLKSIRDRGFKVPSEIQKKSIPAILEGKDVVAGASTGSGKTLGFAAGLIKNTEKDGGIQGLILTPTRELAEQVADELRDFARYKELDVVSIYGGVSIIDQIKRLTRAEIVVGTPGRILDHLKRDSIDFRFVKTLVLDEADRMLDMGFIDDVEKIILNVPNDRQTLLFSATIGHEILRLAQRYMKQPIEISAEPLVDPKKLEQVYYDAGDNLKYSLLKHLLENEQSGLVMIFCNTRRNVDFVANNLKFMGIEALPIHGGFSQEKRNRILDSFHSKKMRVLVATDIAARGLDIKGVTHVYNYDIPPTKNDYIHRIGRTARAGKQGKVINIIASRDYENFSAIVNAEFQISKQEMPFINRVRIRWMPEKKHERTARRRFNSNNSREDSRGNSRGDGPSRFGNKSSGSRYGSNNRPRHKKQYRR